MVKKSCIVFLCLLGMNASLFSQNVIYNVGLHSFFDNNEFEECPVKESQTMAGVHAVPQIGLEWNTKHRIFIGVDAMHEFGSNNKVDYWDPIAYYEFAGDFFRFYMGAFPRKLALDNYPLFFFQDSIRNYRPTMTGMYWEYTSAKEDFMNVWLDWTSRQTFSVRETFFMGLSGRYNWKSFYGQNYSYVHHFACSQDPDAYTPVCDNVRIWTALGADLSSKTSFDNLDINIGWAAGLDRDRWSNNGWLSSHGILSQLKVEYRGLGLHNTFYRGDAQGKLYNDSPQIYWDDPLYRTNFYNRLDGYIYFIKTNVVQLKLCYSLHFIKEGMFHQQQFYASFDLDNLKKKQPGKNYRYFWDNWFTKKNL